jgi:hypothetical protein
MMKARLVKWHALFQMPRRANRFDRYHAAIVIAVAMLVLLA